MHAQRRLIGRDAVSHLLADMETHDHPQWRIQVPQKATPVKNRLPRCMPYTDVPLMVTVYLLSVITPRKTRDK